MTHTQTTVYQLFRNVQHTFGLRGQNMHIYIVAPEPRDIVRIPGNTGFRITGNAYPGWRPPVHSTYHHQSSELTHARPYNYAPLFCTHTHTLQACNANSASSVYHAKYAHNEAPSPGIDATTRGEVPKSRRIAFVTMTTPHRTETGFGMCISGPEQMCKRVGRTIGRFVCVERMADIANTYLNTYLCM